MLPMPCITRLSLVIFVLQIAWGEIPTFDIRNTQIVDTNTAFSESVYANFPNFPNLAAWEKRKAELKKQILVSAGLDPMPPRTPLHPKIFGRIEGEGYTIDKVWLETMPGFYLAGNLYRPKGKQGPFPGVASPHGHWANGRAEQTETGNIPARGVSLAQHGFVVFNYDMVGYSDTKQVPHTLSGPSEQLWSLGLLVLQLWNSIRVLDFLESLPEVDKTKLGATGASGGGTQTFLLQAVDERVQFSAPVNMVSAIMQGGSPCENAPGLRVNTYNVEIAALMAPRKMFLVSATGDWTKNVPRDEALRIKKIYDLYDHTSDTQVVQIDAPHNYNQKSREAVYDFFARKVQGTEAGWKEGTIRKFTNEELLAGPLPTGALTYDQVLAQWKSQGEKLSAALPLDALRDRMRRTLGAIWPAKVDAMVAGLLIVMSRPDVGDRVPGQWYPGTGKAVLVVHPAGSAAALQERSIQRLITSGRSVLVVDTYQTGAARRERDDSAKYYSTFQTTDDARRVQDILTASKWLEQEGHKDTELLSFEKAQLWAAFAAALMPGRTAALPKDFKGTDEEFLRDFFVPGVQRAGGLNALRRLLQPTSSMR